MGRAAGGETLAGIAAFNGLNVAYPWIIPAKAAIATSVVIDLGHKVFDYYMG